MKNLHEIYPEYYKLKATLKAYFYRKSFNDTTSMATIVISASNTTRINNNINMKNVHEIYLELHQITATLEAHFYRKSFNDATLMASIVIRA